MVGAAYFPKAPILTQSAKQQIKKMHENIGFTIHCIYTYTRYILNFWIIAPLVGGFNFCFVFSSNYPAQLRTVPRTLPRLFCGFSGGVI